MHHAFTIRALLKQLPVRIESAVAYSDRLLLGTATGALLIYQISEVAPDKVPTVTLVETRKTFARKAIEYLGVIKEAGVLVCLADGLVTLYDLHTLSNATPLGNTRGAHIIALHTGVDHIDGIPTLVSKLATYGKRKVVVLEWRDAEFYKSFDYSAAEKIVAMQFSAPGLLVLSTAREFLTLQLPRGQWDDLFPADTASLRTVAGGMSISHGADPAGNSNENTSAPGASSGTGMWGSWALSLSGTSSDVQTTIARMPGDKLLLCHKDIGVFINSAGKLCRNEYSEPMIFNRAPTSITYTSSYAVAASRDPGPPAQPPSSGSTNDHTAMPRFNIEVRNIATQALVQSLLLTEEEPAYIFNGTGGKQVWAIGLHTVWRLMPAPIQQQVEDVLEAEQYDEAISLVAQSDNILEAEKEELTKKIRWLRARWLFRDQAKYEEALSEFTELGATPTEAIALCPERIAGELAEDTSDTESLADNSASEHDDPETEPGKNSNKQVVWKEALFAIMRYLTEHRRWLQQAAREGKRELEYAVRVLYDDEDGDDDGNEKARLSSDSLQGSQRESEDDTSLPHVRLKRLAFSLEQMNIPVPAMAQVVDTTLLKVYLECSPGLLGPLLRVKNYCDVEQSEGLLLERKRYLELVDLYHGKGLYRNALQLLQTQGKSADSGSLHGTYATVRYLVRLPADQFDLIVEYLQWPLQSGLLYKQKGSDSSNEDDEDWPDPTTIVSMVFADDRPAAETFPRSRVASFLHQISPALAIQYLKYVFDTWKDKTPALHDDMVAAYFDMLEEKHSDSDRLSLRVKLQQFLKSSSHYSPERALARLPDDRLFMERALVLSRLGRHEHALGLLVFSVANLALAEQYCVENISQRADIFVLLLKLLVSSPPVDVIDNEAEEIRSGQPKDSVDQIEDKRTEIHRQYVGHLLATYPQSIPVADVLPLLPPDMAFSHDIFVYLRSQLCTLDQDVRTKNVVRSLVAAEDLHARRQLSHLQSNFVVISETRVCPQCLKRIGSGTAFAVVPDERKGQVVVHYSCWQRSRSAVSNGRDVSADDSIASPLDNKPQVEIKWA
ncbi:Vacuolar morphogenesis protein 6 [Coemansia sp. RSA 989]|nr:Vacuolar morphogenesis protein 6 [Coemansia sp. RSA 1086]KAJ1752203.1 Vacuolar morphogenesis protein 6 [Coemansia sp. RSA 1821]KAJ1867348.1 Vacuolar morphogenesis protein 6 [Coemansia sp. RSA 989]KAJ1873808.1 Vacuolar morphogenesis protein 6 [Coemansia sp. RSA 990]KAJ2672014.1 Vacuolar morphogenesis protein 6 [Coemansia sp. RSA 1085]